MTLKVEKVTLMPPNPSIIYKELAASINKSTSTGKRYIRELKASGAISRIGGTKGEKGAVK
jgi:predicted HTH transcriptional regulator